MAALTREIIFVVERGKYRKTQVKYVPELICPGISQEDDIT
jgi:hypothetical protein